MQNRFDTYLGIDLGGARGKTTAIATLTRRDGEVSVEAVLSRFGDNQPWYDPVLADFAAELASAPERTVSIAINAPLTMPACVRCRLSECPGVSECTDSAVVWLRTKGVGAIERAVERDLDRIAAVPSNTSSGLSVAPGSGSLSSTTPAPLPRPRIAPYVHRCTEIDLCYLRNVLPRDCAGGAAGPIAARAAHLTRLLTARGFVRHQDLIEVSPRATVHALCGADAARGYKRDADPWHTRAKVIDALSDLRFSPTSRLAREEVLRNDHCFEALLSGYTGYLRDREGWELPDGPYAEDGYIFAP